jgi:hypothetical protein
MAKLKPYSALFCQDAILNLMKSCGKWKSDTGSDKHQLITILTNNPLFQQLRSTLILRPVFFPQALPMARENYSQNSTAHS